MEFTKGSSDSATMESSFLPSSSRVIMRMDDVSHDVMGQSEDSGLSSISHDSKTSSDFKNSLSIKTDEELDDRANELTIGEGIVFVDPKLIADEMREKESKKKKKDSELLTEKRKAQEEYELEVQEQQYKCLLHLLSQSKAFSSFLHEKVKDIQKDAAATNKKGFKRKATTPVKDDNPPPAKRGRKPKKQAKAASKKVNLSAEDISEELESMSDEEDKENSMTIKDYIKPKYFEGELRDYQKVGLNWLKALYDHGLNGILGDEMGLGKTVQIIALISHLIEKRVPGPYLIIVPLSTLPNWVTEFKRFAPKLPVVVFYGNLKERENIKAKITKKVRMSETFSTYPIVIMTYQMPLYDKSFLKQLNWRYIVIDEAQRIKNFNTQLFRILKTFSSVNRLLLTGTPLQNNLSELWSLLNYLLPEVFNDLDVFEAWFDAKQVQNEEGQKKFFRQEQEKHVMSALREILKPFMLRRLKEDVCPDIPPIKEVMVYTPLTKFQYELYSAILRRDLDKLYKTETKIIVDIDGVRPKRKCTQKVNFDNYYKDESNNSLSKLAIETTSNMNSSVIEKEINTWSKFTDLTDDNVNYLIRLRFGNDVMLYRHVVNHPYIIHRPLDDCGMCKLDEDLVKMSGKLLVLDAMLKKLKAAGHKILLFSTMTMVLDIIEDYLYMRQYEYVRLDGSIKYEDRKNNIEKFQTDPEVFIFLLTTKAGAVGLNLASADTVIIYDSDWNPQNDLQAMARCHRIGQTKPVVVYRLCTKGTVDEEIIKRANAKRFLEKAVIAKEGSLVSSPEGLMKLKKLLDENLYHIKDSKNEVYTDAELEELLDRSDMVESEKKE